MATTRKRKDEILESLRPHFGDALALLREESKKSQEKLAKEAGMDAGTLRRLEKGESPLREDYIASICRVLDIEVDDLLRRVADAFERAKKKARQEARQEARKDKASPRLEESIEELIERALRLNDARARSDREFLEILLELYRRHLTSRRRS
ncbi:MAG TPA: helix-turn-helix transcriptional regulator [Thermoanaerobaculia bacterium]|nr:helix-turn-helix transcriptional regulator [Thermoanaerobaculia bacterium]